MDVIIGVCCSMLVLPVCLNIEMPEIWYIALPLSTWAIYLTDHLIDVFRNTDEYPTPRHRFIKKYSREIIFLLIFLCATLLFLLIDQFDIKILITGIALLSIVILHFIIVRINPLKKMLINNKEFAVASIYAIGIYLAPLLVLFENDNNNLVPIISFLIFLTLAFINLLMVSIIEIDNDKKMGNSSWVIAISQTRAQKILYGLFIGIFFVIIFTIPFANEKIKFLLLSYQFIALGHFIIFSFRKNLLHFLAYRKLSEILFWVPALVYFFI